MRQAKRAADDRKSCVGPRRITEPYGIQGELALGDGASAAISLDAIDSEIEIRIGRAVGLEARRHYCGVVRRKVATGHQQ